MTRSISTQVPTHRNRIVVGVDGSPESMEALRFALREGVAREIPVHVVTAWLHEPTARHAADQQTFDAQAYLVHTMQSAAVASAAAEMKHLPAITRLVTHDVGGQTLIDEAHDAALLVVGGRRKSPLARTFLGSVSEFCVRHATVPVVVVPLREANEQRGQANAQTRISA